MQMLFCKATMERIFAGSIVDLIKMPLFPYFNDQPTVAGITAHRPPLRIEIKKMMGRGARL